METYPDPAFYAENRTGSRVLMTKNFKKITAKKFVYFFWINNDRKDVQTTEEAFSPQKRTSSTSEYEISKFF
jgi:hypothetical protein